MVSGRKIEGSDTVEESKRRPKYNLWQNSAFMLKTAWGTFQSVPFLCLALAAAAAGKTVAELLLAPVILGKIERGESLAALLGACVGSFLNCMAWRIVHGEPITKGRSHCDACGHVLSAADLVPVVSFLAHRGKCRYCGAKLSKRHLWGEILSALTFVALLLKYDISLQTLEYLLFASLLLGCAFADLEGYMIPDRFILAGIIFRIPFFFLLPDWKGQVLDAAIGGFAIGGGLLLIVLVYEKIRKTEAMGGGDLKLLFLTGLYLGWQRNLLCLFFACILGIAVGLLTAKKREEKLFPWGPSIAAGAIISALCGGELISAYLGLFV